MAAVENCADFAGPFLSEIRKQDFTHYYKGNESTLLSLLGVVVQWHYEDSTNPLPQNLVDWINNMPEICGPLARSRLDITVTRELGWALLELLRQRVPSGTRVESLTSGRLPSRENKDLYETLAWALGMCITWYEMVEGELTTQVFHRSGNHPWVFNAYLGYDGRKIYSFSHQSQRRHASDYQQRGCFSLEEQPNSIIIGRLTYPVRAEPSWRLFEINLLKLLISQVRNVDPATVDPETRTYLQEVYRKWGELESNSAMLPTSVELGLDFLKEAVQACIRDPPSASPTSHDLRNCHTYTNTPSPYVQCPIGHPFHETCLRSYIIQLIQTTPNLGYISCKLCPRAFSQEVILQVVPHFKTLKEEALQQHQETTRPI